MLPLQAKLLAAFVVPLLWMASSTGLILLNKHLMMDKGITPLCLLLRLRRQTYQSRCPTMPCVPDLLAVELCKCV